MFTQKQRNRIFTLPIHDPNELTQDHISYSIRKCFKSGKIKTFISKLCTAISFGLQAPVIIII